MLVLIHCIERAGKPFHAFIKEWDEQTSSKFGQVIQLTQMDVLRICVDAGYAFGGSANVADASKRKHWSSIEMYQERATKAHKMVKEGYSWLTGYSGLEQRYVYELVLSAAKDSTLKDARAFIHGQDATREADPSKWLWKRITKDVEEKKIKTLLKYSPPGMSLHPTLRQAGIPIPAGA